MSKQRAPEIRARYDWLEQNFPEVAGRIFIVSHGRGETPESVLAAEQRRVAEAGLSEEDQADTRNMLQAKVQTASSWVSMPSMMSPDITKHNPVAFVQFVTGTNVVWTAAQMLPFLINGAPDKGTSMQDMLTAYSADQETIHAVDALLYPDEYRASSEYRRQQQTMHGESVCEAYSVLSLLQREQRGEFKESTGPFLDNINRRAKVGNAIDVDPDHLLVDEALTLARDWAKDRDLRQMTPRAMLDQAHRIADRIHEPTPQELQTFRQSVTAYDHPDGSPLFLLNLPTDAQQVIAERVVSSAGPGWAGRQLRDSFNALAETHKDGPYQWPRFCWPEGKEMTMQPVSPASEIATPEQKAMLGTVNLPVDLDGAVVIPNQLCRDNRESPPRRPPQPGPFDDMH